MSESDRRRWDARHGELAWEPDETPRPPRALASGAHLLPRSGTALDLACGRGASAVWLALRGMRVWGVDVSPVAIDLARQLADHHGIAERCRFSVFDLDLGLPDGPPVDLILSHLFRDPRLYRPMANRLAPGGILAIAVLSEVDAEPGSYRAKPGALAEAFTDLRCLAAGEGDGVAWLVGERG